MAIPTIAPYRIPDLETISSAPWRLDPSRSALLVHDMQNYFIDAFTPGAEPLNTVITNIQRLLACADQHDMPVFFTAQPPAQASEQRGLLTDLWGAGIQTSDQAEIIDQLSSRDPKSNHHIITKWRYSAFNRTDLRDRLDAQGIDQLIITGVYGHMGCMISAADAFMNDIQPFLIHDAIADFTPEDHARASQWVGLRAGIVLTTSQAIDELTDAKAPSQEMNSHPCS